MYNKNDVVDQLNQNEIRSDASVIVESITETSMDSRIVNSIIAHRATVFLQEVAPWMLDEVTIKTPQYDENVFLSPRHTHGIHTLESYSLQAREFDIMPYTSSNEDAVRTMTVFINEKVCEVVNEAVKFAL